VRRISWQPDFSPEALLNLSLHEYDRQVSGLD
jgi:hypothetical protein